MKKMNKEKDIWASNADVVFETVDEALINWKRMNPKLINEINGISKGFKKMLNTLELTKVEIINDINFQYENYKARMGEDNLFLLSFNEFKRTFQDFK